MVGMDYLAKQVTALSPAEYQKLRLRMMHALDQEQFEIKGQHYNEQYTLYDSDGTGIAAVVNFKRESLTTRQMLAMRLAFPDATEDSEGQCIYEEID